MVSEGADVFRALLPGAIEEGPEPLSAHRLLSALMDSLESAVFWKDLDRNYLGCNTIFADIAGRSIEDIIGLSDDDMPWFEVSGDYEESNARVVQENRPFTNIRERVVNHAGEELWVSTSKAPLHDTDGNVIGLVGTFHDITSELRAEAELQKTLTTLDERVTERTVQLLRANQSLRKEVDARVKAQAEERRLREQAEIHREIGAAMSRTMDLDKVLDALVGGVQDLVTNDLVAIVLTGDDGRLTIGRLETSVGYHLDEASTARDLDDHPSLHDPGVPVGCSLGASKLGSALGSARSTVAVEMVTGGILMGYIVLESRWTDFYQPSHAARLDGIAEQASAAIYNCRLTTQTGTLAAAAERDRLRRDLHDSVVQTLAAAAIIVDTELVHMAADDPVRPAFERIQRLSADANTEIRELLNEMRPGSLAKIDLIDLILRLANRPDWPFSIDVTTSIGRGEAYGEFTTGLYRIVQEALTNAAHHSDARRVVIDLKDHPVLSLSISDDGVGFDPDAVHGDHLGLSIMAERADEIGGTFTVQSTPGTGTTIQVTLEATDTRV